MEEPVEAAMAAFENSANVIDENVDSGNGGKATSQRLNL